MAEEGQAGGSFWPSPSCTSTVTSWSLTSPAGAARRCRSWRAYSRSAAGCEVLSPSTERYDRAAKVALYAAAGVAHAWLVNPLQRTLEILRLSSVTPGEWSALGVHRDDAKVRAEPFEELELDLSILWRDVQL